MARTKKTEESVSVDELDGMLTRLKLTAIRDQLDTLLDQASRADMTLREALTMLCTAEVARKDERRIQMGMSIAKFPCVPVAHDRLLRRHGRELVDRHPA